MLQCNQGGCFVLAHNSSSISTETLGDGVSRMISEPYAASGRKSLHRDLELDSGTWGVSLAAVSFPSPLHQPICQAPASLTRKLSRAEPEVAQPSSAHYISRTQGVRKQLGLF